MCVCVCVCVCACFFHQLISFTYCNDFFPPSISFQHPLHFHIVYNEIAVSYGSNDFVCILIQRSTIALRRFFPLVYHFSSIHCTVYNEIAMFYDSNDFVCVLQSSTAC